MSASSSVLARDDNISSELVRFGIDRIKKNPIKTSFYILGLIICLFVNGYSVSHENYQKFDSIINKIDYEKIARARDTMLKAQLEYEKRVGFFWSCNDICKEKKDIYFQKKNIYDILEKEQKLEERNARGYLGIFSNVAVAEARELFWKKFAAGKEAANRQSKWDAFWIGLSVMGKDESFFEWIVRVIMAVLMNFSVGIIFACFIFIFSLYELISQYNPSTIAASLFFVFATSAAVSFCLSFIIAMYIAVTGVVLGAGVIVGSGGHNRIGRGAERRRLGRYED